MGRTRLKAINDGDVLVVYKKGSRGEIIGVYETVDELVKLEQKKYAQFNSSIIYRALSGHSKAYASYHHQCRAVVRIRPLAEVREKLQQEAA